MLFYQIGELFQSYAVGKSRSSISALMDIRPDSANLEAADGGVSVVDPDDVAIGSTIVVKPGEKIPLDGVVLTGESTLNTAALTGESRPRTVRPGDESSAAASTPMPCCASARQSSTVSPRWQKFWTLWKTPA